MKYLLTITTLYLLLSMSQVWALPECEGSPQTGGTTSFHNCEATYIFIGEQEGYKYVGEWQNGTYNGKGTLYLGGKWKGDKYVGEFIKGTYWGHGTYYHASGQIHVGYYIEGYRNGHGTSTMPNGGKFIGEWKDGQRYKGTTINGKGEFEGDIYVGEYINDLRHGFGTYTFSSGEVYEGQWHNGNWVDGKIYILENYSPPEIKQVEKNNINPNEIIEETFENAKVKCEEIGFKKGTEKFGQCVLDLTE